MQNIDRKFTQEEYEIIAEVFTHEGFKSELYNEDRDIYAEGYSLTFRMYKDEEGIHVKKEHDVFVDFQWRTFNKVEEFQDIFYSIA